MVNISTAQQLYDLMISTSSGDMSQSYTLTSDINMTGFNCESIGKYATPFTGNFNGGNYNIIIAQTNLAKYFGFFGYCNGAVSNCVVMYGDNFTINPNEDYAGGFIGKMSSGSVSNCSVMFGDNATIKINTLAMHSGIGENIGHVGGFIGYCYINTTVENIIFNTNFSNCNIAFGSNANISSFPDEYGGNCGGFIGHYKAIGPNDNSISINYYNCNIIFKDFAKLNSGANSTGGFMGMMESKKPNGIDNSHKCGIKNCTATFGDSAIIDGFYNGGFAGGMYGSTVLNCSCIFGSSTTIGSDENAGFSGGFLGASLGGRITNCNTIFGPSYKFLAGLNSGGDKFGKFYAGTSTMVLTNCHNLAYGSKDAGSGLTLDGPGSATSYTNQTNVLNSYNADSYIQWFAYKIRFDQNISTNGSVETDPDAIKTLDTQYLKDMLNLSPDVPNFIKNYTIKASNIATTYADIKNILSIQSDSLPDDTPITYLEQASSYTLDNNKNYYIPASSTTLTIDGNTYTVSSNVSTGTITITFNGVNYSIRTNNSEVINGVKFSNHGTGSIVLGVEESAKNSTTSNGLEFWWWILIVLGIILVVFLLYYFIRYYFYNKNVVVITV